MCPPGGSGDRKLIPDPLNLPILHEGTCGRRARGKPLSKTDQPLHAYAIVQQWELQLSISRGQQDREGGSRQYLATQTNGICYHLPHYGETKKVTALASG